MRTAKSVSPIVSLRRAFTAEAGGGPATILTHVLVLLGGFRVSGGYQTGVKAARTDDHHAAPKRNCSTTILFRLGVLFRIGRRWLGAFAPRLRLCVERRFFSRYQRLLEHCFRRRLGD